MEPGVVLAVGICVGAAIAALVATVVILIVLRRRAQGDETALVQTQMSASVDSLRHELRASLEGATQSLDQRMAQLTTQLDRRLMDMGGEVGRRLDSTSGMIGERLEGAARAVAEVHQKLGTVQGATERVLEIGKDIASLQQILRSPKLRGGLGELFLGELLAQVLPADHFELQHGFRSGQRVDAVVRVGDKLVSIDAKFPLENFTRIDASGDEAAKTLARKAFVADVRRRIDEIASRYILPDEGTFDFALMYVPAENVYYETIIKQPEDGSAGIHEYAHHRRVIPVSPNTLFSYLQVILLGLRGLRIEDSAQEILRALSGLGGDLDRFRQEFQILGRHIEDASKKFGEAARRLQKLNESVERLEELGETGDPRAVTASEPAEPG